MKTSRKTLTVLMLVVGLVLLGGLTTVVLAGTFVPITLTDQTPTAPLANPAPSSFQPRYISGFGSDNSFTVFFEDRDAGNKISYASTTSGPTGFPASATATNIADTHFCVKDWSINIDGTDYAYRAWGSVGNNMDHRFYVSNDLTNWTLVSTFTIPNAPGFTDAHGWVYYGFHDVIELNGTYYAFAESNQSQTMIVSSANGDDVWEAFASVGGRPGWGPLELPAGVSYGWTPSGNFVDLGHDRGYGKIHVDPRDNNFYLAVNTAAKASLPPADLEAAFINPANWTWHDGTTGPASNPILSATSEHDLRECWVVPNTNPDADWVIIYDADFGSADGGKALGYATLTPPTPPPAIVYVDDNYDAASCTADGHTWQVDCFDVIQDGVNAVASGGTVHVAPGTYIPSSTIVVNKSLTILGPQAGVDPRPSASTSRTAGSANEAIIDGGGTVKIIFRTTASDVVLNGLEVRNGKGDLIDSPNGSNISNVILRYNIIRDALDDEGIQLRDCTDCVIEFNHVFDIAQDGINMCCDSTSGTIQSNEVHDSFSENAAIYVYDADGIDILDNLVYNVTQNDGIKMGDCPGEPAPHGSIQRNVVYNTAQDGITIYSSNTLVEGNEVYNSTSENGALYVACPVSNVTIRCNYVHDNALATWKWGDPGGILIGTDVNATTVFVNDNSIHNNSPNGVTNKAAALLDATNNWWGSADGPAPDGSGDQVSANVSFDPYLSNPSTCAPGDFLGPEITVTADPNPAQVSTDILVSAVLDDSSTGGSDIADAYYTLNDSGPNPLTAKDGAFDSPYEEVQVTISSPPEPAVEEACVTTTDAAGNGATECFLLVWYDPAAGFVTGGGWIWSPEGAYVGTTLTGKATFGFVSKYKKGAQTPEGQTEFVFKAADLNFHSDSYDWLVVAGAKAKFKGTGTINGVGNYGFMLTAIDAELTPSTDVDLFRIKIWDKDNGDAIVYDNQMDAPDDADPTTAIGGGSIVIHTKKK